MNKQPATHSGKSVSKVPPPSRRAPAKKKSNSASGRVSRIDGSVRLAMIAQGAYFRAEQRGFAGGRELDDWLEAEREIARMLDA